jgi:hypothetical protein
MPQATKANLPEQIRRAQAELRRLGCFDGNFDGKMSTTEKAIKEFLKHRRHKPAAEKINITDDFIAELQRQPEGICPPASKKSPTLANRPPAHNRDAAAASRPREPALGEARQPPPQPPQPPSQPARAGASLGTGF